LEIDEKKLDAALKDNMEDLKDLFGYDSDGDLIIDSGIAYTMDKQLQSYVQTGGILANKTAILDSQITTTQGKITKLEDQLEEKEKELKNKYSSMEATLNSLESQSTTISNFSNNNSNK
jgi:flagellar hook-associated protein 2